MPAYLAAHPPEHPDYAVIAAEDSDAWFGALLAGKYGPLLDSSGLAIADDTVVAGIVIADLADPEPPFEGPWVMELFRDPRYPGTGRAAAGARADALGTGARARRHRGQPAPRGSTRRSASGAC